MSSFRARGKSYACSLLLALLFVIPLFLAAGCGAGVAPVAANPNVLQATALGVNPVTGDTTPVHDPSIITAKGTYYVFSSDPVSPAPNQFLSIRCSADKLGWKPCGQVFTTIPAWVGAAVPGMRVLWAPDVSFFNGLYHLYYAGSTAGSQASVIGLATNPTLDPADPAYRWTDAGQVLASRPGDDFNAIDPNILVDSDRRVWLTYGSYWSGIKQREIDAATGLLLASNAVRYQLAARPGTPDGAVEGPSLVHNGGFYYLFLSIDHCCESTTAKDDYKQVVGRSVTPNGPFVDAGGTPLMQGGGSVLLAGSGNWIAPGGGSVYLDAQSGDSMIIFHALDMSAQAASTVWIKSVSWQNGWPVLN
jgi:arabinan endo-1,5-alpha-L-arabinosidase